MLEDMLRACVIEFGCHWDNFLPLAEFSYNNSYHSSIDMAPFEALYGRRCRSPIGWFDAFEVRPWGTDLLRESLDKVKFIQEKLLEAQNRQKEYADRKVRDLDFIEGEQVLLKVSPMKGEMRFGKRGKLSPRYIGPFEVLKRVGEVAYELALPPGLSGVHPVFHVSMLKRYHGNGNYIIRWDSVFLDENLSYEEEPVAILDREVRKLRSKEIASIKISGRIGQLKSPLGRRRLICKKDIHIFLQIQVLFLALVFLVVIIRGRTMGKLLSIVTTCLVV